jgi:hypothetical protein
MRFHLPGASEVCLPTLLTLTLLPAAAGLALTLALLPVLPAEAAPQGMLAFALGVVKLCYLGTAAAHVGRGLAEQADGALARRGWRLPDRPEFELHPMRRPGADAAADTAFWARFPNAFDGALLAAGLMTLVHLAG